MREKILFRATSSTDPVVTRTISTEELFEGKKLCSICYDYKNDVIDWNCKRGCIFEFCKECKKEISSCPLCKEPYGLFRDNSDISEDLQIFLSSNYSLVPGPNFPVKITIGSKIFYMSIQDYKPKNISPAEKESLGPIWTKIVLGNNTAYDSMVKLGSGKGLKLDIYEEWNDDTNTGSFKIGITKLTQKNKVNIERSHSFIGSDEDKSVYISHEKFGNPSPSSSRKRKADAPPPVVRNSQSAERGTSQPKTLF